VITRSEIERRACDVGVAGMLIFLHICRIYTVNSYATQTLGLIHCNLQPVKFGGILLLEKFVYIANILIQTTPLIRMWVFIRNNSTPIIYIS